MISPNLPTCSLIITTYNWPEALEKSLLSALSQTYRPNEIIIADDGSDNRTAEIIKKMSKGSTIPILHVWHPDQGFRLSAIRNKAIASANYEYIVQIDGDIVMEKHFIYDHLKMAKTNIFLCGSRVSLKREVSNQILKCSYRLNYKDIPMGYWLNSFRVPLLAYLMADRYKRKKITALRGCNMSFWKNDLIAINGYNNDIKGWGSEDAELAIRLVNSGVKKRALKFMGIAFHLYHPESSRVNKTKNELILTQVIQSRKVWTENGIQNGK